VRTRRTSATAPTIEVLPERHGYRHAVNLGTKWEQYWRYQPNATTISEGQASIVTGVKPKTFSIAATCFQYHEYGRRAGLKIRCVCHPPRCPRSVRSRGRFPPRNATVRLRDDRGGSMPLGSVASLPAFVILPGCQVGCACRCGRLED
jgi:hypothetical protein